jgi:hypothetical protein
MFRRLGDLVRDLRVDLDPTPALLGDRIDRLYRDPHALVLFEVIERLQRLEHS